VFYLYETRQLNNFCGWFWKLMVIEASLLSLWTLYSLSSFLLDNGWLCYNFSSVLVERTSCLVNSYGIQSTCMLINNSEDCAFLLWFYFNIFLVPTYLCLCNLQSNLCHKKVRMISVFSGVILTCTFTISIHFKVPFG